MAYESCDKLLYAILISTTKNIVHISEFLSLIRDK